MTEGYPERIDLEREYPPETPVHVEGFPGATLGWATAVEEMFCPADSEKRADPALRNGRFAQMLHQAGTLRPEHLNLLPPREQ